MPKPRVFIAYTGGTIGMKKSPTGYAPVAGYLAQRMAAMPEFQREEMPDYTIHAYEPLLDSSNMSPVEWGKIAADVVAHYDEYDGFIIIHGTDTMAYTAAALSFMLENLGKPVILTGSQIPLVEVRSDARENLITTMMIAAQFRIPEVCIYMNGRLLRGNRAQKVNATGFGAFDSPNFPALGEVGVQIEVNWPLVLPASPFPCRLQAVRPQLPLASLRLFPGISADLVRRMVDLPLQGLVLETYGAGNAPSDNVELLRALAAANERGTIIVNCTQCLRGCVDMDDYATGHALKEVGVVNGYDMTTETALAKLYYLLSQDWSVERVKRLMESDLRGELTRPKTVSSKQ